MAPSPGDRLPAATQGYQRASEIISVALTMTLPALCGWWLDNWLGTSPWVIIGGAVLGLASGLMQLLKLSAPPKTRRVPPATRSGSQPLSVPPPKPE